MGSYLAQATTTATVSSTPYTMTGSDRAAFYVWTGALGTLNLPAAASVGNNWFVNVRNGGTGNWTIDPSGTDPAKPLPIDNRTVLHLLEALQVLRERLPGGGPVEPRRLSFRALDVDLYQAHRPEVGKRGGIGTDPHVTSGDEIREPVRSRA